MRDRSFAMYGAAGIQAVEAAGVCVAAVLSAIDTATGKSYELGSGIALTLIGFATVAALAVLTVGLAKGRSWSWTPAMIVQLFIFIVGIYLLQSHRYDWGGASVGLSIGAAVLLLLPSSLTAYGRRPDPASSTAQASPSGAAQAKPSRPAQAKPSGKGRAGSQRAR